MISKQIRKGLFEPFNLGSISLKHKIVMAPMTRLRAGKDDGVPSDWAIEYYSSRATDGGLIISEAVSPSPEGRYYFHMPGIYSKPQIQQWKKITDAVHSKGGKMILQVNHAGRVAIPGTNPHIYAPSENHDPTPGAPNVPLKVMNQDDIDQTVKDFTQAAKNGMEAGFDGVEIHGANGYLIDQFTQSVSNLRTDSYGGSTEGRIKFPLEIAKSISSAIGAQRVGFRISPFSTYQGMKETSPLKTFSALIEDIYANIPEFGYIHAIEPRAIGDSDKSAELEDKDPKAEKESLDSLRDLVVGKFGSAFIVAGGYSPKLAVEHAKEYDDLISIGRHFTSNPDLVERIKNDLPLTKYDRSTFYSQGKEGYLGWPNYGKTQSDQNNIEDITAKAAAVTVNA